MFAGVGVSFYVCSVLSSMVIISFGEERACLFAGRFSRSGDIVCVPAFRIKWWGWAMRPFLDFFIFYFISSPEPKTH